MFDQLITTTTPAAPKMIVYGPAGAGKTSLAASADAVLIDCENGAGNIAGLTRTPYLDTWPKMRDWLTAIAKEPPKKALAIDTIDWMVQRICEHVVLDMGGGKGDLTNTLGSSHGGYYKAREIVLNLIYRDVLPMLNYINGKGVSLILLAHAHNAKITTPEGFTLQQATPDLPTWGVLPPFVEWADAVIYIDKQGEDRQLVTTGTNTVLAKNRYRLPPAMPFPETGSWQSLVSAITRKDSK